MKHSKKEQFKELAGLVGMGGNIPASWEKLLCKNVSKTIQSIQHRGILQVCKKQYVQVAWGESDEQFGMAGCANFVINPYFIFLFLRHMSPAHVLPLCAHTYPSGKKCILCPSVLGSEHQFSHQIKSPSYPLEKHW